MDDARFNDDFVCFLQVKSGVQVAEIEAAYPLTLASGTITLSRT